MKIAQEWKDYRLLDMADGEKLEQWGKFTLIRPDPQVIWKQKANPELWKAADAHYFRSRSGGGHWEFNRTLPESWEISYKNLRFNIKPMGFKHTGLFPEQAVNWDFMTDKIKARGGKPRVLNLFAYTGGATVACLSAGASVCHVDASKGMVARAKENAALSGLAGCPARYIVDDCVKFCERELRRGNKYDAIIMDPPSYGRGTNGEVWTFEDKLFDLVSLCAKLLSDKPMFFLINSYTTGISATVLANLLKVTLPKGNVTAGEIGLSAMASGLVLPCGIYGRWER